MTRTTLLVCLIVGISGASAKDIPNRLIDYDAFANQVASVGKLREERRVTEEEFIEMANDPATVIFDARSAERYQMLHVKGARHLSFSEFTEQSLASIIPDKSSRILIYCNNNFLNAPNAFASKAPSASLNIFTINALHSYGYTNVYELGPLIDIRDTRIEFLGSEP